MSSVKIFVLFLLFLSPNIYGQKSRVGELAEFSSKIQLIPFDEENEVTLDRDDILNHNGPITIFFWLSTCGPCIKELNNVKAMGEFNLLNDRSKIIVVSDDNPKKYNAAKLISEKNNWNFNMYFDKGYHFRNSLLNRWYGVPQVMIIDKDKKVVLHKFGYKNGDEKKIAEKINHLIRK